LPWLSLLGLIPRNPRSVLGALVYAKVFSILRRMALAAALISTKNLLVTPGANLSSRKGYSTPNCCGRLQHNY
jgi:hypothetical protein